MENIEKEISKPWENIHSFISTTLNFSTENGPVPDELMEAIASNIAKQIGLTQKSDNMQQVAFIVSKFAILEIAENVLNIGSGFTSGNMTAFTLAQIKNIVKNIEKKVDIILATPLRLALDNLKSVINMLETNNYEFAYESFGQVLTYAMQAFQYSKQQSGDADQFNLIIISVKLIVFSKIARYSFNRDQAFFLPFYLLKQNVKKLLAMELENIVEEVFDLQKNIQTNKWLPGAKKAERAKTHELVDSVLKLTYPFISEGHGWTSMSSTIDSNSISFMVTPYLLPKGESESTNLKLGNISLYTTDGEDKVITARIWREENSIFFLQGLELSFNNPCEPIQISLPFPLTLTFNSTDNMSLNQGDLLGEYQAHGWYSHHLVYRQLHLQEEESRYLYKKENNWWVSNRIGKDNGWIKNQSMSKSPPQEGWQYKGLSSLWYCEDRMNINPLPTHLPKCGVIKLSAEGEAASMHRDCLGEYEPSGKFSCGHQIFQKMDGSEKYLLIKRHYAGKAFWGFHDNLDPGNYTHSIRSAMMSGCPADPKASRTTGLHKNWNSWLYFDKEWREGKISLTCSVHGQKLI